MASKRTTTKIKRIFDEYTILIFISTTFVIVSGVNVEVDFDFNAVKNELKEHGHVALSHLKSNIACKMCKSIVKFMIESRTAMVDNKREFTDEEIEQVLILVCTKIHAGTEPVCAGLIKMNVPLIMDIMVEKNLNECQTCQMVFEYQNCCDGGPTVKWSVDLKEYGDKPKDCSKFPHDSGKVAKIAHITDLHWDQSYVLKAENRCKYPICCRWPKNFPSDENKQAGIFGSYPKCDIPLKTIEATLQHMRDQHGKELLFIVITGDFVEHNIWETTQKQVETSIITQTDLINKYFPDTPVFYSAGNHDMNPTNLFANPKETDFTNWLYKLMIDHWTKSLDDDARSTIEQGGFYTFLVDKGPRIISLNSMYCYNLNWWLMYDPIDPAGQLKWLADTLSKAESKGEMVYIIQHISVGTIDCLSEYSREFWRILTRFHCTIKALFTGHVHLDETKLIYDIDDISKPIIPVHNGGSITTFEDVNVNYKIYEVDTQSWDVLNAESWVFDLDKNVDPPEWYKLYSFRDDFKVASTKPEDLDKVIHQLASDEKLMKQYNLYYAKDAHKSITEKCDRHCLNTRLCDMVTTNYTDKRKCEEIVQR